MVLVLIVVNSIASNNFHILAVSKACEVLYLQPDPVCWHGLGTQFHFAFIASFVCELVSHTSVPFFKATVKVVIFACIIF